MQVDPYLLLPSYATNTTCIPQGGRSAGRLLPSPSVLRHENPTELRANLPLGGLAAAQCSPKFLKILPSGEQTSHSEA